jgi:hypothetical protein
VTVTDTPVEVPVFVVSATVLLVLLHICNPLGGSHETWKLHALGSLVVLSPSPDGSSCLILVCYRGECIVRVVLLTAAFRQ